MCSNCSCTTGCSNHTNLNQDRLLVLWEHIGQFISEYIEKEYYIDECYEEVLS